MKKIALGLLLSGALISASLASHPITGEEDKGNWTQTFQLQGGMTITHSPQTVNFCQMMVSPNLSFHGQAINGVKLSDKGLVVNNKMSKEEFVKALIASGLYKK